MRVPNATIVIAQSETSFGSQWWRLDEADAFRPVAG
jgi:hypothetical protein